MAACLTATGPLPCESALDLEAGAGAVRQFLQRWIQPLCLPVGRGTARATIGGTLGNGLVQVIGYAARGSGLRPVFGGELALERIGVEGQAHQLLAQSVVNILADAGLLAVADLEDLVLQVLARFRSVMSCCTLT